MKKINFKNLFSYFLYQNDSGTKIKIMRDWKLLILFFVLSLVIMIATVSFIFWKIIGDVDREIYIDNAKEITINRSGLKDVLNGINIQKINFDKKINAPDMSDPSR